MFVFMNIIYVKISVLLCDGFLMGRCQFFVGVFGGFCFSVRIWAFLEFPSLFLLSKSFIVLQPNRSRKSP